MEFNSDCTLSFFLQRLGSPGRCLKPQQVASILAICIGKNVFIWLPTGFSKSVCYDMIPVVMDCKLRRVDSKSGKYTSSRSLVLLISTLIPLIVDQVINLRQWGVNAAVISYGSGVKKSCQLLQMIWAFAVCASEALVGSRWREAVEDPLVSGRIVATVVDEAHRASKW